MHKHYLSAEDFLAIYSRVPRLAIDVAVFYKGKVLLALRDEEPFKNEWNLPGGTIYKDERAEEAAMRIIKQETGLDVRAGTHITFLEFPEEQRSGTSMHTISIVMEAFLVNEEDATQVDLSIVSFFDTVPENTVFEHAKLIKKILSKE